MSIVVKDVDFADSVHRFKDSDDQVEHESVGSPLRKRGLRRWHAGFETERRLNFSSFNVPWHVSCPFNWEDDPIENFMQRGVDDHTPHTSTSEQIYRREQYRVFTGVVAPATALVIDGAPFGSEISSAPEYGPLTAQELEEVLRRPRFPKANSTSRAAADYRPPRKMYSPSIATGSALEDTYEAGADRRIIYVTDLDRRSINALIRTVSVHEADALRDCLCRHLTSDVYAGVTSSTSGLEMFELAFHLPFKALRTAFQPSDPRAQDVSFLNWDYTEPIHIYSGTYSCTISGFDNWHWVAYCFIDTYHGGDLDTRESAEAFHDDALGSSGMSLDPCCNGAYTDSVVAIPDPRQYFLKVLEARLSMVVQEWRNVIQRIECSTEMYRKVCENLSPVVKADDQLGVDVIDLRAFPLLRFLVRTSTDVNCRNVTLPR